MLWPACGAPEGANAVLINDADAAGLAELTYGDAGLDRDGLTIVLTFGTGIGSALLHNGDLIANSELGGLVGTNGRFEEIASGRAISTEELSPVEWARRAQPFFDELEAMLNPSRWVVGGGLSENFDRFASSLEAVKAHLGGPPRRARRCRRRRGRRAPRRIIATGTRRCTHVGGPRGGAGSRNRAVECQGTSGHVAAFLRVVTSVDADGVGIGMEFRDRWPRTLRAPASRLDDGVAADLASTSDSPEGCSMTRSTSAPLRSR